MFNFPVGRMHHHMHDIGGPNQELPAIRTFAALYATQVLNSEPTIETLSILRFYCEVELLARSPALRKSFSVVRGEKWGLIAEAEYEYLLDLSGALDLMIQAQRNKVTREFAKRFNEDKLNAAMRQAVATPTPQVAKLNRQHALREASLVTAASEIPIPVVRRLTEWAQESFDEYQGPKVDGALTASLSPELREMFQVQQTISYPLEAMWRAGTQVILDDINTIRNTFGIKTNTRSLLSLSRMMNPQMTMIRAMGWWALTGIACYRLPPIEERQFYLNFRLRPTGPVYYIINLIPAMPKTYEHQNHGSFAAEGNTDSSESLSIKSSLLPRRPDGAVDYGLWATFGSYYAGESKTPIEPTLIRFSDGNLRSNQAISRHIAMGVGIDSMMNDFLLGVPNAYPLNYYKRGDRTHYHYNDGIFQLEHQEDFDGRILDTPSFTGLEVMDRLRRVSVEMNAVFWHPSDETRKAGQWMTQVQQQIARIASMNPGQRSAWLYREESQRELNFLNSMLVTQQKTKGGGSATFDLSELRKKL